MAAQLAPKHEWHTLWHVISGGRNLANKISGGAASIMDPHSSIMDGAKKQLVPWSTTDVPRAIRRPETPSYRTRVQPLMRPETIKVDFNSIPAAAAFGR